MTLRLQPNHVSIDAAGALREIGYLAPGMPTYWEVFKWLREEKRLMVIIDAENECFCMRLKDLKNNCYISGFPNLDGLAGVYEDACDNGILAACEHLQAK